MIVEANLYGTHEGPLRGLPPTGRRFEMRFCAVFVFEEDRLVCERVYFDQNTVLRQLGIAHDPSSVTGRAATMLNHPVTVGRAVARQILRRLDRDGDRAYESRLLQTVAKGGGPSAPVRPSAPRGSST